MLTYMGRIARVRELLERRFAPEHLEIDDRSAAHLGHVEAGAGGSHLRVVLVSAAFRGHDLLSRQRAVYEALGDAVGTDIHALSLRTLTPEEWPARDAGREDQGGPAGPAA
jgi:BolA protein